jgi:hypothetical protein
MTAAAQPVTYGHDAAFTQFSVARYQRMSQPLSSMYPMSREITLSCP